MAINYWTGKPDATCNPNIPSDVEIIGRVSYCSGEIVYTYYCQRYNPPHPWLGGWAFWKCCDWVHSLPQSTNMQEIEHMGLNPHPGQDLTNPPLTTTDGLP
jgi:hypothetical protein